MTPIGYVFANQELFHAYPCALILCIPPHGRALLREDPLMSIAPLIVSESPITAALDRAQTYVLGKQSPRGGFCFYRGYYVEEPNLADTWHGLAALTLLGISPSEPDTHAAFVLGQPIEPQPFALYYRVRALHALEADDPMEAEVKLAVNALQIYRFDPSHVSFTTNLQRLRCVLWLKKHFHLPIDAEETLGALLASEDTSGGFGSPPNVLDTETAIGVLQLSNRAIPASAGEFLQRMAAPWFGFRLTAGSLSPNLETTCAGVIGCSRTDKPVPHAKDAIAFILSCQTGNGGFSRTAGALPDLALTHMALTTLIVHLGDSPHVQSIKALDCHA